MGHRLCFYVNRMHGCRRFYLLVASSRGMLLAILRAIDIAVSACCINGGRATFSRAISSKPLRSNFSEMCLNFALLVGTVSGVQKKTILGLGGRGTGYFDCSVVYLGFSACGLASDSAFGQSGCLQIVQGAD